MATDTEQIMMALSLLWQKTVRLLLVFSYWSIWSGHCIKSFPFAAAPPPPSFRPRKPQVLVRHWAAGTSNLDGNNNDNSKNDDMTTMKTEATPPPSLERFYPIGTPGQPWTKQEDEDWKARAQRIRSYQDEVVQPLEVFATAAAASDWEVLLETYGTLSSSSDANPYPLLAVRCKQWKANVPNVLITGGVHGYETSGVQGALLFLQTALAQQYKDRINWVVIPCVSPWSYEHMERWQADLLDPNRSFFPQRPDLQTPESKAVIQYLQSMVLATGSSSSSWTCHLDLHETTNSDATEFRPAKFAKAGANEYPGDDIPDGFYLVGSSNSVAGDDNLHFLRSIIQRVKTVTHIAPTNEHGHLVLNQPAVDNGIMLLPFSRIGLCCGVTDAPFVATTEMYPDSPNPNITPDVCNQAQVAAIAGALDFVLASWSSQEMASSS